MFPFQIRAVHLPDLRTVKRHHDIKTQRETDRQKETRERHRQTEKIIMFDDLTLQRKLFKQTVQHKK